MTHSLDLTADIIDTRDIIERIEELETELADMSEADHAADLDNPNATTQVSDEYHDMHCELLDLIAIMDNLKGNGGDEQWRGDWYPVTLIRESYFEEAMDEMVADCYELPKDLPSFMTITLDYRALQMDYTSTEIDGVTFLYR